LEETIHDQLLQLVNLGRREHPQKEHGGLLTAAGAALMIQPLPDGSVALTEQHGNLSASVTAQYVFKCLPENTFRKALALEKLFY
jgi:hypothetical protein